MEIDIFYASIFREHEDSPSEVSKTSLDGLESTPANVGWSLPLLHFVVAVVVVVLVAYVSCEAC